MVHDAEEPDAKGQGARTDTKEQGRRRGREQGEGGSRNELLGDEKEAGRTAMAGRRSMRRRKASGHCDKKNVKWHHPTPRNTGV